MDLAKFRVLSRQAGCERMPVLRSPVQSLRELSKRSGRPAKELGAALFLSADWAALEEGPRSCADLVR